MSRTPSPAPGKKPNKVSALLRSFSSSGRKKPKGNDITLPPPGTTVSSPTAPPGFGGGPPQFGMPMPISSAPQIPGGLPLSRSGTPTNPMRNPTPTMPLRSPSPSFHSMTNAGLRGISPAPIRSASPFVEPQYIEQQQQFYTGTPMRSQSPAPFLATGGAGFVDPTGGALGMGMAEPIYVQQDPMLQYDAMVPQGGAIIADGFAPTPISSAPVATFDPTPIAVSSMGIRSPSPVVVMDNSFGGGGGMITDFHHQGLGAGVATTNLRSASPSIGPGMVGLEMGMDMGLAPQDAMGQVFAQEPIILADNGLGQHQLHMETPMVVHEGVLGANPMQIVQEIPSTPVLGVQQAFAAQGILGAGQQVQAAQILPEAPAFPQYSFADPNMEALLERHATSIGFSGDFQMDAFRQSIVPSEQAFPIIETGLQTTGTVPPLIGQPIFTPMSIPATGGENIQFQMGVTPEPPSPFQVIDSAAAAEMERQVSMTAPARRAAEAAEENARRAAEFQQQQVGMAGGMHHESPRPGTPDDAEDIIEEGHRVGDGLAGRSPVLSNPLPKMQQPAPIDLDVDQQAEIDLLRRRLRQTEERAAMAEQERDAFRTRLDQGGSRSPAPGSAAGVMTIHSQSNEALIPIPTAHQAPILDVYDQVHPHSDQSAIVTQSAEQVIVAQARDLPNPYEDENTREAESTTAPSSSVRDVNQKWPSLGIRTIMLDDAHGNRQNVVVVHEIIPSSPAEQAGIQPQDIIERFGARVLDSKLAFNECLDSCQPGDMVNLVVIREKEQLHIPIQVGASSRPRGERGHARKTTAPSRYTDHAHNY